MRSRGSAPSSATLEVSLETARRLAVSKQLLSGPLPKRPGKPQIRAVVRDLCYVQVDPVSIVAPGHVLTLWSRLGPYRAADLEGLLWKEKALLYGWTHAASIFSAEDFPLMHSLNQRYPESLSDSWGSWREYARKWIPKHAEVRRRILAQLRRGPMRLSDFEDHARNHRGWGGWGSWSEVSGMLGQLQLKGEVSIVGHEGIQNLYGLSKDFLPRGLAGDPLPVEEVERRGIERSLRALGIASVREIQFYFLRGRYLHIDRLVAELETEGVLRRVHVDGWAGTGPRYIHREDVDALDSVDREWAPRLSLLSPFDSLICRRDRIRQLFGFDYAHENYIPRERRKFGVYVMPILEGDRFLGRLDPKMDREHERLVLNAVHAEPRAPGGRDLARQIRKRIDDLADFLGAKETVLPARLPDVWKSGLR